MDSSSGFESAEEHQIDGLWQSPGGEEDLARRRLGRAVEVAAGALDVARVEVWVQGAGVAELTRVFSFSDEEASDAEAPGAEGETLPLTDVSLLLEALEERRDLVVGGVDHRLVSDELARRCLEPHGLGAFAAAPVRRQGEVVGLVLCGRATSSRPWSPEDRCVVGQLGVLASLTLALDEQRRIRSEYEQLLASVPIPVVIHQGEKLRYLNRAAADLVGMEDPSEWRGTSILQFVLPSSRDTVRERIGRVEGERQGVPTRRESVLRLDGELRQVEVKSIPVSYAGRPATQTIVRDVTEEKRAEERLARSEERYRRVFQESRDAIYITTREGRFVEVNPACVELFGYSREELDELNAEDLYVEPGERDRFVREVEAKGSVEDYEVLYRRSDGTVFQGLETATVRRDDAGEVLGYQGLVHDITEQKELEEELRRKALHDALTGLANRVLFFDRLEHARARARRADEPLALVFLDLDRFKSVNDRFGHRGGDAYLREVARRLVDSFRDEDTVARLGGDEFSVLVENPSSSEEAAAAVDRLVRALEDPVELEGEIVRPRVSIGLAFVRSPDEEPEAILHLADQAMYRAKERPGLSVETIEV